jgi:ferric-dicitrate binding protein FerR (iron transport regulator)
MSVEETHSEFDQLISRYLSGELSPEEERDFQNILNSDSRLRTRFDEFQKIWDAAHTPVSDSGYDLDAEWNLMKAQIPELKAEKEARQESGKSRTMFVYTYRIAALLIMGLLLGLGWNYASRNLGTIKVVAQEKAREIVLDDGTQVILNRDSRLRYKKHFSSGERTLSLSGEAWFDVARDTTRPFVIDAGAATVEVLGTSFNVNAYKENTTVEITVESGMVALSSKQEKQTEQEQIILRAGNSGSYHKENRELILTPRANPNNNSWRTRELYFDDSSLQEVVDLVSKVYGANLVIMNADLAACHLTVTFSNQSLESVLSVLEVTLDLEITHAGDEIRLDGEVCN